MALTILTIGSFLLFSTSRYFPDRSYLLPTHLVNKKLIGIIGALLLAVSFGLLLVSYDLLTAILYWLISWGAILSALILSLRLNPKWIYVWGAVCLLLIIVDFV